MKYKSRYIKMIEKYTKNLSLESQIDIYKFAIKNLEKKTFK